MKSKISLRLGIVAILLIITGAVLPRELDGVRLILIVSGVILLLISLLIMVRKFGNIITCPTCNAKFEWKMPVALKGKDNCITCPYCGTLLENRNIK